MIRLSATLPSNAATGKVGAPPFTFAGLFSSGQEGYMYDINDLSTLKSDRAGTTAAAAGGPVGRILDASGNNNTMRAASDAKRATLYRRPKSTALRNRVSNALGSEDFTGISVNGLTYSTLNVSSPLSNESATVHTFTNASDGNSLYAAINRGSIGSTTNTTYSFYAKINSTGANPAKAVYFFTQSGSVSTLFNLDTGTVSSESNVVSSSITAVSGYSGWFRCVFTVPENAQNYFTLLTDGTTTFTNNVSAGNVLLLQGVQIENGNTATAYQQKFSSSNDSNYTEHGIDTIHYLRMHTDAFSTIAAVPHGDGINIFGRVLLDDSDGTVLTLGDAHMLHYRITYDASSNNTRASIAADTASGNLGTSLGTFAHLYDKAALTNKLRLNGTEVDSNNTSYTITIPDNQTVHLGGDHNSGDNKAMDCHFIMAVVGTLDSATINSIETKLIQKSGTL